MCTETKKAVAEWGGVLHFLAGYLKGGLVTTAGAWGVVDPVEDDEWQAANHEDDSHHEEDGCLRKDTNGQTRIIKCPRL